MVELPSLSDEFRGFLIEAKAHGYGSSSAERVTLASGAVEITYEDDNWLYTDSYVGGSPFAGYEHVSARHPAEARKWLPVWGMSYYGAILHKRLTGEKLGELLGQVLSTPDSNLPVRGPTKHFFGEGWGRYELRGAGSLERFEATETIGKGTNGVLYRAHFIGGIIDHDSQLEQLKPTWLTS